MNKAGKSTGREDATGPSARPPRRARAKAGEASSPRLPHERDESNDSQADAPRRELKQAYDDIEQGQQDTDRHGMRGYEKPENRLRQPANGKKPAATADRKR